ncbi:MAG: flagellar biosynthetic protein FliO [Deltaproteobacteria bacterium]|nr:flagellar biosynthetic protein FliO [Deltaproteobacteria bacterium]
MTDAAADLGTTGGSLAVSFLSLGVVCVVAYVALRLISARTAGAARGALRVVARTPLEPRRSLLVVDVAGRGFLLASSEAGVALIAEVDADTMAKVAAEAAPAVAGPLWQRLVGKVK